MIDGIKMLFKFQTSFKSWKIKHISPTLIKFLNHEHSPTKKKKQSDFLEIKKNNNKKSHDSSHVINIHYLEDLCGEIEIQQIYKRNRVAWKVRLGSADVSSVSIKRAELFMQPTHVVIFRL